MEIFQVKLKISVNSGDVVLLLLVILNSFMALN